MSDGIARGYGRWIKPVSARGPRFGLARVLSKRGLCSRSEAERWVAAGRVQVDGRLVLDPEHPCDVQRSRILIDGQPLQAAAGVFVALNKPRGLVTTARDERGRETVYRCFKGASLPWIAPVGRLDKASEGLLLFSNDPVWAAAITEPQRHVHKTYHVQVDAIPGPELLQALQAGFSCEGEFLRASRASLLRQGARHAWLEIRLDEGRNRQIRRLLAACDLNVLRLVRVAIGPLRLGNLGKGCWRHLHAHEVDALRQGGST